MDEVTWSIGSGRRVEEAPELRIPIDLDVVEVRIEPASVRPDVDDRGESRLEVVVGPVSFQRGRLEPGERVFAVGPCDQRHAQANPGAEISVENIRVRLNLATTAP